MNISATQACKNCGNTFTGEYCNQCGQKAAHRLDTPHIFHEAIHVFTHADKGIFSMIPAILFRPGIIAREYVQGKRKRYFSIFQYLIIIVGLVTFLITQSHMMENMADTLNAHTDAEKSQRVLAVRNKIFGFLQHYLNLVMFALIPVFAFFSWLIFKSKGYNYAENFILQVSIQAQINTYSLFFVVPMAYFFGKENAKFFILVSGLLIAVCNTLSNYQFFRISWAEAFFKGLLVYLLTNIVEIILIIVVIIIMVIYKLY